jgi:hypothetical protein
MSNFTSPLRTSSRVSLLAMEHKHVIKSLHLKSVEIRQSHRFTFHPPPRAFTLVAPSPRALAIFFPRRDHPPTPPPFLSLRFAAYPTPFPMPPPLVDLRPSSPSRFHPSSPVAAACPSPKPYRTPTNPQRGAIAHRTSPRHRHLRNR